LNGSPPPPKRQTKRRSLQPLAATPQPGEPPIAPDTPPCLSPALPCALRPPHPPIPPPHSETGRLLLAFLLGAACTAAGSVLAMALFPLAPLGEEGWRIAAALTARHIGALRRQPLWGRGAAG
jgi:hypothetical protein